ncbi:hypothetical protein IJG72_04075 [bacterium]|nr:hypothetical protein [bacterium]
MLNFLKKKEIVSESDKLNGIYEKLKEYTRYSHLSEERKNQLRGIVEKYGYLNYPHLKILEELSAAETLCVLEVKWEQNGVFKNGKFEFSDNMVSPLARNNVTDSDWIKKEGHDIKLINLAALGNGNYSENTGKFFDWIKQIAILPTGDLKRNIFNTTIYLIPFQTRDFGCAYLPTSSSVSECLNDTNMENETGLDVQSQVQLFIKMAQLAGHPVIYDVLPQAGRFEKNILANPEMVRWYNINDLIEKISNKVDEVVKTLESDYDSDDIEVTKNLYKQRLKNGTSEFSPKYQEIYDKIDEALSDYKKEISFVASKKENQKEILKQVKKVIADSTGTSKYAKLTEKDITPNVIENLTSKGLWTLCGGAWCSAGVPVFQKMSECGGYPIFKHYNFKDEDVTEFANLDCQTPYYFAFLENGEFNKPVIDLFINHLESIQNKYGFDGFRVDHVDHIVDDFSTKNGVPISYRAPSYVLGKLNSRMKSKIPYFAVLAEYMLWDKFYKEYHEDMHFDILWGNDIICQSDKTPQNICNDNQDLTNYNVSMYSKDYLSILKTYNNQDGEFDAIDQYPAQLGENGAIFKWFKYKFLPGGKFANRPVMYVDGDETFTQNEVENTVGNEVSMKRNKNYHFFNKFDSINRLAKSLEIVTEGEAQIILQEEDGFVSWLISKEMSKTAILVVANYKAPTEKITVTDEDGNSSKKIKHGEDIFDKNVTLPGEYYVSSEFIFNGEDFEKVEMSDNKRELNFEKLYPSEFRIFELKK